MPLYEVAILEVPTRDDADAGEQEKLIFGPKCVIAKDSQSAAISVVKSEDLKNVDTSRISILIRPFA